MYRAEGNCVFYVHPDDHTEELFLTVHPTQDCIKTPEQVAVTLADLLTQLPVKKS